MKRIVPCSLASIGAVALLVFASPLPGPPPLAPGSEKVLIIGQVIRQGQYPWREKMTVGNALEGAGGLAQFAAKRARITNPSLAEPLSHHWRRKIRAALLPLDDAMAEAFSFLELPWDSPSFDWLEPSPISKATVNLTTPEGLSHLLDPQDILIVPEVTLNL